MGVQRKMGFTTESEDETEATEAVSPGSTYCDGDTGYCYYWSGPLSPDNVDHGFSPGLDG